MASMGADGCRLASSGGCSAREKQKGGGEEFLYHTMDLRRPRERRGRQWQWRSTPAAGLQQVAAASSIGAQGTLQIRIDTRVSLVHEEEVKENC
jgi:hypothetical protein